jgi:Zn-dependent protease with chaperone function
MSGCYEIFSVRESNETGSDHPDPRRRRSFAMHVAVYVPLVLPLLAAASARWLAGRLPPRLATWVLTATTVVLAAASGAALTALAATAVGQLPLVATLGRWSVRVLRADDPASLSVALVACVLLIAAVAAAVRALICRARALLRAARMARRLPTDDLFDPSGQDPLTPVVVVDDPRPDAYALPGVPGRIVVSTGMLDGLDTDERRALLEHERTHLRHGHHAFLALAALAAATNPLLRPVAAAVGYATERWADECAAAVVGDRRTVARAIARAALLLSHHAGRRHPPEGALAIAPGGSRTLARTRAAAMLWRAGPVPRRVAALLAEPPRRPRLALGLGLAMAMLVVAAAASIETARDLETLFELARLGS